MARRSMITDDMEHCYICGRSPVQIHHCIYGSRRKLADEDGLVVPLCVDHHDEVHNGGGIMALYLKQVAQKAYEEKYGHEAFMQRYGKNYI